MLFEPIDFVAKLAALVPRPRKNLVLYHGVLSANAAWRSRVLRYGRTPNHIEPQDVTEPAPVAVLASAAEAPARMHAGESGPPRYKRRQWAELMRRAFGYDLRACSRCGGRMKLLAVIVDRATARKILIHLHLSGEPLAAAARAPP